MPPSVTVFFDYTCAYSRSLHLWLRMLPPAEGPAVTWRTLSLKEFRQGPHEPSPFQHDGEGLASLSILALALAHAAREADFDSYHDATFDDLHSGRRISRADLLGHAARAGVDVARFEGEGSRWLEAVAAEHREGVERWRALGTPTLVFDDARAVYVRMRSEPDHARRRWDLIHSFSVAHPEMLEIKRSV